MFTYYSAKARQAQLLREAEQDRLARKAKRAKRAANKQRPLQTKGRGNRRLHASHA